MENIYVVSGIISIAYLLFKFAEMRCLQKETKPLKDLARCCYGFRKCNYWRIYVQTSTSISKVF